MASAAAPWHPHYYSSLLLLLLFLFLFSAAAPASEHDVLLRFKASLSPSVKGIDAALHNWVPGSHPCRYNRTFWTGVLCNGDSTVRGVRLENMSLAGELNTDALAVLPMLRTMSFMNNSFRGPIPDLTKFPALKSLYLSSNRLSGEIPDGIFGGMHSLKKVHLSRNDFSGKIPSSLLKGPLLLELRLDDNNFEGTIPNFRQPDLHIFNVSYNNLRGPIPTRLRKMHADLFAGNDHLCGAPLANSCYFALHYGKYPAVFVAGIILIIIAVILILIALFLIFCRRRQEGKSAAEEEKLVLSAGAASKRKPSGKLIFLKEVAVKFNLEDLLRASAEILGSANFGSTYKAILPVGPAVVVKRFKEMNGMGKGDFHEYMGRIGRLSHPNLVPLLAYSYRKEEKLFVTSFIFNGSLAHMLHGGNYGTKASALDWPTRLKIVKGIARGLSYLAEELPELAAPHGHLKSSNVLLNYTFDPILSDYALIPLINGSRAAQLMVAFKSPECSAAASAVETVAAAAAVPALSKKSDVWSLGILVLEILTGKFPENYQPKGPGGDDGLAGWVTSKVEENKAGEVFDENMTGTQGAEPEMMRLLRVGLSCSEPAVEKRCELEEAVKRIEALSEFEECRSLKELSL